MVNSLLKREFVFIEKEHLSRKFFHRLIWNNFSGNRRKQKFYRTNAANFLKVWIEYNEHILSMMEELPADDYIAIDYTLLEKYDKQVFSFLTKTWHFALQYFSFKDVYNKSLISKTVDIDPFVDDPALLSKAKSIEDDFKKYILSGNVSHSG